MIARPLAALALTATTLLAACAPPPGTTTVNRPTAAQAAACRQRADEVYERQNRADTYRADIYAAGTRDAMFSSTGSPAASVMGLSGRFARDRMLDDCLRGVAGNVGSTPDAPLPTATPAPAPVAPAPRARP